MMDEPQKVGDLEVHEDLKFERRQWTVERIGWLTMLALIIAALLGAFGRGPLSKRNEQTRDKTLSIEYDRFGRLQAQTDVKLKIAEAALSGRELRLWLDRAYMARFEIKEINPEPERIDLGADRMTLVYRVPQRERPLSVNLILEPVEFGSVAGAAGVEGKDSVTFSQFVYP